MLNISFVTAGISPVYFAIAEFRSPDGTRCFQIYLRHNACCGILELCHFAFLNNTDYSEEMDELIFRQMPQYLLKGIYHLTLTWSGSSHYSPQPPWFHEWCKRRASYIGERTTNPNTGNTIKFVLIPQIMVDNNDHARDK